MASAQPTGIEVVGFRTGGRKHAIVFIHGFFGDPRSSWQSFPQFLADTGTLSDWDIVSLGLRGSLFSSSVKVVADRLIETLNGVLGGYDRLALITHGEGGIVAQLAIVKSDRLAERVSHAFFFASPNAGVAVSGWPKTIVGCSALLRLLPAPSFELQAGGVLLQELRAKWTEKFGKTAPFQYWLISADRDSIVFAESLTFGSAEHRLVVHENHVSVVKPDSPDAESVQVVVKGLQDRPIPEQARHAASGIVALESKVTEDVFDVFLYSDRSEREAVKAVTQTLQLKGYRPWVAGMEVLPGRDWEDALMKQIDQIAAAAIFVGKSGLRWAPEELSLVEEFSKRQKPVIPVYLKDGPLAGERLPEALARVVPVELADPYAVDQLISGITGKKYVIQRTAPQGPSPPPLAEIAKKKRRRIRLLRVLLPVFGVFVLAAVGWRIYEHWIDCGRLHDAQILSRPGRNTAHYVKEGNPDRVLVFVHGLFGNAEDTWTSPPDIYWPDLVANDKQFDNTDIYVAKYDTAAGNRMTIDEVTDNLNQRLIDAKVFSKHRQVVFVCHSLGSLVVQRLLLRYRDYAKQVPLIYFYGTPQTGAQIANVGRVFSADPLLAPGESNDYLMSLESDWRGGSFPTRRYCAYEKMRYKCVLVVDQLSGTRNCDKSVAVNKN